MQPNPLEADSSSYRITLAKDLLDDIETSRLAPRSLLLKAMRLARITNNDRILAFLQYELFGYPDKPDAMEFGRAVGRMTNPNLKWGYWDPLPALAGCGKTHARTNH